MPKPNPDIVRILSFDPAIGHMGYSVLEHNLKTGKTVIIRHGLIRGDKIAKERLKTMQPEFQRHYTVLCAIYDTVASLMDEVRPHFVATEGPFSHRFVKAYASLKLVVDRIRQASHHVLNKDVHEIQPTEIKNEASGHGFAKKEGVKAGLLKKKDLTFTPESRKSFKEATEHEVDAIGAGYCFIKRRLTGLIKK